MIIETQKITYNQALKEFKSIYGRDVNNNIEIYEFIENINATLI